MSDDPLVLNSDYPSTENPKNLFKYVKYVKLSIFFSKFWHGQLLKNWGKSELDFQSGRSILAETTKGWGICIKLDGPKMKMAITRWSNMNRTVLSVKLDCRKWLRLMTSNIASTVQFDGNDCLFQLRPSSFKPGWKKCSTTVCLALLCPWRTLVSRWDGFWDINRVQCSNKWKSMLN